MSDLKTIHDLRTKWGHRFHFRPRNGGYVVTDTWALAKRAHVGDPGQEERVIEVIDKDCTAWDAAVPEDEAKKRGAEVRAKLREWAALNGTTLRDDIEGGRMIPAEAHTFNKHQIQRLAMYAHCNRHSFAAVLECAFAEKLFPMETPGQVAFVARLVERIWNDPQNLPGEAPEWVREAVVEVERKWM